MKIKYINERVGNAAFDNLANYWGSIFEDG
jgi:hypothetical protein